jgi:hypothetical protein
MKIIKLYEEYTAQNLEVDYAGEHSAPTKEDSAPLYDLSGIYPADIYSSDAFRMYASGNEDPSVDRESLHIIQSCKGKPNKPVKIWRAVPDVNRDVTKKIKDLVYILNYRDKFPFFPPKNVIVRELEDKHDMNKHNYTYDEMQKLIYSDIESQLKELVKQKSVPIKINNGDWVTISRAYSVQHGKDNLLNKYKLISKTVYAKQLFTDGNDINEWGYNV